VPGPRQATPTRAGDHLPVRSTDGSRRAVAGRLHLDHPETKSPGELTDEVEQQRQEHGERGTGHDQHHATDGRGPQQLTAVDGKGLIGQ